MSSYKPSLQNMAPLMLLVPTETLKQGVPVKTFPKIEDGALIFGQFKTYGGTERDVNGLYSIEDTAIIETWYRPDITSSCRIGVPLTGAIYEIIGEPENIELRNQLLKFKVRRVKGGV